MGCRVICGSRNASQFNQINRIPIYSSARSVIYCDAGATLSIITHIKYTLFSRSQSIFIKSDDWSSFFNTAKLHAIYAAPCRQRPCRSWTCPSNRCTFFLRCGCWFPHNTFWLMDVIGCHFCCYDTLRLQTASGTFHAGIYDAQRWENEQKMVRNEKLRMSTHKKLYVMCRHRPDTLALWL